MSLVVAAADPAVGVGGVSVIGATRRSDRLSLAGDFLEVLLGVAGEIAAARDAGHGIAADGPWTLALLVPLLIVLHYGVIIREERYLERKFGDDYRRYRSTVRRWL